PSTEAARDRPEAVARPDRAPEYDWPTPAAAPRAAGPGLHRTLHHALPWQPRGRGTALVQVHVFAADKHNARLDSRGGRQVCTHWCNPIYFYLIPSPKGAYQRREKEGR